MPFRSLRCLAAVLLAATLAPVARAQNFSDGAPRPVTLTGSLTAAWENYSMPGLATQRPVNTARLFFNPTLTLYGVSMPFSVVLSTNERSWNQPFNQFGVSPQYQWLTLHLGYRTLQFAEFAQSDATVLGAGAEVRTGDFHAAGMYGRYRRSIEEDTVKGILPVYKRMGWFMNAGYGDANDFLDVNIVHAWDDSTSLARPPALASVFPVNNLVLDTRGRMSLITGRLFFDGEFAGSLFTRDTRQPEVQNSNVTMLDLGLHDTRVSTRFNLALKLAGTYTVDAFSARMEYARVEPDFESCGATYIQNDREDITLAPEVRLLEGRLRAGGSLGFRRDNLFDDRGFTTHRVIGSANLSWAPSAAFGIDGQYSNYSMSNRSATLLVNDSTRVENVSENYSLTPRYLILGENLQHYVMALLTRQSYADRNVLTGALSDNNAFTAMLAWTATWRTGLNLSTALQFTEVRTAMLTNIIRGVTLGAGRPFFDNRLMTNLSWTLNLTRASAGGSADMQHILALSARYRLTTADGFELRLQYNNYNASSALSQRQSYAGTTSMLQYTRSFGFGTGQ
jgi:hypothetical protein